MANTKKILFLLSFFVFFAHYAFSGAGAIVKIHVEGNQRIPASLIIVDSGLEEGGEFNPEKSAEAVRGLYSAGYLDDVSIESRQDGDGLEIIIRVKERPVIRSVNFKGNKAYSARRLKGVSGLSAGAVFDLRAAAKAREELISFYTREGFAGITITEDASGDSESLEIDLTFVIEEGVPLRKVRVKFSGNTVFTDKQIRSVIQTGKTGIFRAPPFRRDVLQEDLQRIIFLYHSMGYIDADASVEAVDVQEKVQGAVVRISVSEGRKYTVGRITIPHDYSGIISLEEEAAFSPEGMRDDIRRVYEHLYADGYLYAEVHADRSIDAETGEVDISFTVREGPPVFVERINISGNLRTRDDVIRREIRIKPGERFNISKVRESQRRLRNLGSRQPFFENVTFEIEDGTVPDRKNLHFKVAEGKTGTLLFGAGYSSDDKLLGFIEAHVDNFDIASPPDFMGAGQDLSVKGEMGSERRDYTLSFTEPWLFHVPLSFGVDGYNRMRNWSDYDEGREGGRLRLGYPAGDLNRLTFGYKYEDVNILNLSDDVSSEIRREEGVNALSTLTLGFTRDTRDNFFDPRHGARSSFTAELAGGPLRGDKNFRKYTAKTSRYFPAWAGGALNLRFEGGYAEPFSDTEAVPVYERFYLGGADTVRGYSYRHVGPKDEQGRPIGGNVRLMANLEYIIPLIDNLKGAVFFDAGNVWSTYDDADFGDIVAGAGIGIRIMSPLGPLRLDYAYGFDTDETRLHFTIGWPF